LKKPKGCPVRVVGTVAQRQQIMADFHESEWAGNRGIWQHFQRSQKNIGGKVCTKILLDMWKLAANANNTLEFGIEIRFI
jgi:hypothetical protein